MCGGSIREFVELDTPIFMFDKDGAFVVMRLEQVCYLFPFHLLYSCRLEVHNWEGR
jgi:hypothetical protein